MGWRERGRRGERGEAWIQNFFEYPVLSNAREQFAFCTYIKNSRDKKLLHCILRAIKYYQTFYFLEKVFKKRSCYKYLLFALISGTFKFCKFEWAYIMNIWLNKIHMRYFLKRTFIIFIIIIISSSLLIL